ncbi:hypothetical protein GLYMA_06G226451v4 [Glycine max]|nr:hypothetical protein GLYMA_06G226451v4 [Glycine max]KAH1127183.1 hypothetical protein GYH30_015955 [Glycine max]
MSKTINKIKHQALSIFLVINLFSNSGSSSESSTNSKDPTSSIESNASPLTSHILVFSFSY